MALVCGRPPHRIDGSSSALGWRRVRGVRESNTQLIYGTGTACATGETNLTGAYPTIAQTGLSATPNGGIKTAAGNALCIELSAAVQVSGVVTYLQGAF